MIQLSVFNVSKHYGPEPVLDGVSFDLRAGERVGLVGPNGAGKTTLMKIVAGLEEPDGGRADLHAGARLGMLEQQATFSGEDTVWDVALSALADLLDLAREAERVAQQLADAEDEAQRQRLGDRFESLQHQLQQRDGYQVDHRIERVLSGLGFASSSYRQPARLLSGGQQNRLLLARLLLAEPEVMLLDEPSNHLDLEATEWLENFLVDSRQAQLLVSHDRFLLDRVTTRTLELFQGTVENYAGNYTAYCRQKEERLEVQRRTYERQQEEIAKLEDFVRRHHHGQKHAQAEDRRKKLERIERVAPPREIAAPPMGFPEVSRSGDVVLRAEGVSKAFATPLFQRLSFTIQRGQKWGILGPNGTGKTTLLRCLLGQLTLDEGQVTFGTGVQPAYFDQQLECVDTERPVMDAIIPPGRDFDFVEQARRDLLARFGITGDMAFQPVRSLSGGERNRTALARLAATHANLLVLDEPTNHLDLWARGALEHSLLKFQGTVLFVSHDRYFLNQVADHLLVVEPSRFRIVEGNYDHYRYLTREDLATPEPPGAATGGQPGQASGKATKTPRAAKPSRPKRRFPYRKVADLEQDIAACEAQIAALHEALGNPDVLRDGGKVKQATADLEQAEARLQQLYEHWEEACELN